ncbi:hypothetical protein Tco_1163764 [Tanacetum coccineum]
MDDPNITMEEYIRLEEEKTQKHRKVFNWENAKYGKIAIQHLALPPRDQRHQYLRVQVFDFVGLPDLMAEGLSARMLMEHRDAEGQSVLISCSIAGRSQAPEKVTMTDLFYLRGIDGLTVIALELPIIDMAELVRLQIYMEVDDTWDWVALGPERQPDAMAGAPGMAQDTPAVDEARLEEDVHEIHEALVEQRKVIGAMARDFSRFTVWAADGIAQLLDSTRVSYTLYFETRIPY